MLDLLRDVIRVRDICWRYAVRRLTELQAVYFFLQLGRGRNLSWSTSSGGLTAACQHARFTCRRIMTKMINRGNVNRPIMTWLARMILLRRDVRFSYRLAADAGRAITCNGILWLDLAKMAHCSYIQHLWRIRLWWSKQPQQEQR